MQFKGSVYVVEIHKYEGKWEPDSVWIHAVYDSPERAEAGAKQAIAELDIKYPEVEGFREYHYEVKGMPFFGEAT